MQITCTPTVAAVEPLKTRLDDETRRIIVLPEAEAKLSVVLTFANADDLRQFRRYVERAKETDGTVAGLYAGLMCSAVKRAKIL